MCRAPVILRAGLIGRSASYLRPLLAAANEENLELDAIARAAARIERLVGLSHGSNMRFGGNGR